MAKPLPPADARPPRRRRGTSPAPGPGVAEPPAAVGRVTASDPAAGRESPPTGEGPASRPAGTAPGAAQWIALGLDVVAVVATVAVAGLMLFLVVARYVLGLSIVGLHELILIASLLLYMTGALIASRRGEHLTVDWIEDRLRAPRARAAHGAFVALVTLIVAGFFLVWSGHMLAWGLERPQATPAYRIPVWTTQLPILFAAAGCLLYAGRDLARSVRALRG